MSNRKPLATDQESKCCAALRRANNASRLMAQIIKGPLYSQLPTELRDLLFEVSVEQHACTLMLDLVITQQDGTSHANPKAR